MSKRKLRPQRADLVNKAQIDRVSDQIPEQAIIDTERAMDDAADFRRKHGPFASMAAFMACLDGMEKTNEEGLGQVVKDWHRRAIMGKRSWEAN